ncbi:MAG: 5'/3'-nucleotidase SurE [bacterium]
MADTPFILLTNDDGINAPGLSALYQEVNKIADSKIVAPSVECSGVGHGITILDPLRINEIHSNGSFYGYAVGGTTADCVKTAVFSLFEEKPDVVISGINLGPNTGINMFYSGTVSGAAEGAILGIPSFAISLATFTNPDFTYAAKFARKFADKIIDKKIPKGIFLNVNVPPCPEEQVKGIKVTSQGKAIYKEKYDERIDPFGRHYYWLTGHKIKQNRSLEIDESAVQADYISITPLHIDMTNYNFISKLKEWDIVR